MLMQGTVKAPPTQSLSDNNSYDLTLGKYGSLLVTEAHGKYFNQNIRGNVYYAGIVAAAAVPVFATNAAPTFCIWNPSGNNRAVSLLSMKVGYVSGTPTAGVIGYAYVPNAGSTTAGTAAISAFTTLTVRSGMLGQTYPGNVLAGSAATLTGTGIGTPIQSGRWSGLSQGILASASIPPGMNMRDDFDGTMVIPPGVAWFPIASAASVALFMLSAEWEEVPWP